MKRAAWLVIAVLAGVGAGCQRKELDELKAKNAALEAERDQLKAELDALKRQAAAAQAPPAAPAAAPEVENQLVAAQDAYVHGQYRLAIDLASKTIDSDPPRAWRVIGASNCFLKDKQGAAKAYSQLDDHGKSFLKYVCSRSGVKL